jgi:hypothetical protein
VDKSHPKTPNQIELPIHFFATSADLKKQEVVPTAIYNSMKPLLSYISDVGNLEMQWRLHGEWVGLDPHTYILGKSRSYVPSNDLHYLWLNTCYRLDFSVDF